DRAQIEAQGVQAGLDGEVDLRFLGAVRAALGRGRPLRVLARLARRGQRLAVGGDDVDALLDEVAVELGQLLLGDLDLLERGGDLLEGEEAALLALREERLELVGLGERRFVGEQSVGLRGHVQPRSWSRGPEPVRPAAPLLHLSDCYAAAPAAKTGTRNRRVAFSTRTVIAQ